MTAAASIRLADYTPWAFELPTIALDVTIQDDHVVVASRLSLQPRRLGEPLELCGVDLAIESLVIDQEPLQPEDYSFTDGRLVIPNVPGQPFVLETRCRLDPYSNSSLEGLYASGGLLSTQCEAEGFRRISLHPDRPDVLSRWQVRIEANRSSCPVLLSNGNAVQEESVGGDRHAVTWDDPFPKPSYLFALVAGDLREIRDHLSLIHI